MHFTLPALTFLALATTGALATSGGDNQQYSIHLSSSATHSTSSHAAVTTPIPTNSTSSKSSSEAVPSKTSAAPSKSSSAVQPSKSAGGGGGQGGSGSGSGSGGEGEGEGEGGVPTFVPGNPAARIDAQEATFLGAALGVVGAFAALV